jgi:hypothetical protein
MKMMTIAPLALMLLAACGGNPFVAGTDPTDPTDPTEPGLPQPTDPVVVATVLAKNMQSVAYDADSDSFLITMQALDTTPVTATWTRRAALDIPGYDAYAVQEDPLDRMFVGLARTLPTNGAGTVTGVLGGDGGQFNKVFQGASYSRTGPYTAPVGTDEPGSGQVSYAGNYAGLSNIAAPRPNEARPVDPGTPAEIIPGQPARVTGDVFINANFSDNSVNGAIYNRILIDYGFNLQSVILTPTDIQPNGTFVGEAERWVRDDPNMPKVGDYGGVFAGNGANAVAGAVALTKIYWGDPARPVDTEAGQEILGGLEHGLFVLQQCGTAGAPAICSQSRPDFTNP